MSLAVMHARRRAARGFTLIELAVTMTLVGVLLAVALPSFMAWIRNAQVRAVADSLQSGVRRAQTEAVRLNQGVVFSLTSANPALNTTAVANGKNWAIQSIAQFADPNHQASFLTGGSLADVSSSVTITGAAAICFNSNGRLSAPAATGVPGAVCDGTPQQFNIEQPGRNLSSGDRRLRVLVAIGGQVRMCDPDRPTLSATAPDGCP
ncbi:MAG: GspH/FimT family pseudopilin [Burkholderiales bacterium]